MEFIDNVTPSLNQYQQQLKNYDGSGGQTARQRANDWASMYYQNAYNLQMLNYMNEYNSPLQQMLRYQEAGINPFLAASNNGNMSSAPAAAAPKGSSDNGIADLQGALATVDTLSDTLGQAKNIYDYLQYGRPLQEYKLTGSFLDNALKSYQGQISQANARRAQAEADFSQYWNLGQEFVDWSPENSPRAKYMQNSTDRIAAQIDQLEGLVNIIYPTQAEANSARSSLDSYRKEIMEGKNQAILNIDTGNETRDAILKLILFWLGDQKFF